MTAAVACAASPFDTAGPSAAGFGSSGGAGGFGRGRVVVLDDVVVMRPSTTHGSARTKYAVTSAGSMDTPRLMSSIYP